MYQQKYYNDDDKMLSNAILPYAYLNYAICYVMIFLFTTTTTTTDYYLLQLLMKQQKSYKVIMKVIFIWLHLYFQYLYLHPSALIHYYLSLLMMMNLHFYHLMMTIVLMVQTLTLEQHLA